MPPPRTKKTKQLSRVGEAAQFIKCALGDKQDYQRYVRLVNGFAIAFDGIVAAGYPIDEDLAVCPDGYLLAKALAKCGTELTIAKLANGGLSVKGGKLRAVVPCLEDITTLPPVFADPPIAVVTDRLKDGFAALAPLASDSADTLIEACLLLQGGSMVSTNRFVLMEYWHGIDLPPNLIIPKAFAKEVIRVQSPLTGFGYGPRSITLHFEDKSWLRTQLYQEGYPDYKRLIEAQTYPVPVPEDFFSAVETVAALTDLDAVYLTNGAVRTVMSDDAGAIHDCEGLEVNEPRCYSPSQLKLIAKVCGEIDFNSQHDRAFFFGPNIRGAIMGRRG